MFYYTYKYYNVLFSSKEFDALFLLQFADEQSVVVFSHDKSVESLYDYLFLFGGMHHAVMTVIEFDVIAYAAVAVDILLYMFLKRAPCTKVAPSEVGRMNKYLFSLLHYSIIYRDILGGWEAAVYEYGLYGAT